MLTIFIVNMFLTEIDIQYILQKSFFSNPMTESDLTYQFYRNRKNIELYTARFNIIPSFSIDTMIASLQHSLFERYSLNTPLHVNIMHDLLLCDYNATPNSFYIWRANSNRTVFDMDNTDIKMDLTQDNIIKCCNSAVNYSLNDFDVFFHDSKVTVVRVLSIVLAFDGKRINTRS